MDYYLSIFQGGRILSIDYYWEQLSSNPEAEQCGWLQDKQERNARASFLVARERGTGKFCQVSDFFDVIKCYCNSNHARNYPFGSDDRGSMKALTKIVTGIHMYVGVGAVFGGMAAILNPDEPLGISSEMLNNGPFDNYLIPGLFLFFVLGFGNILCSILTIKKAKYYGVYSGLLGGVLVLWIMIQCYVLKEVGVLHVVFFLIGLLQGVLAFSILFADDVFPVSVLKKAIDRILQKK